MMDFTELVLAPSDPPVPFTDQLRLAVAAYLARFKGSSRLRIFEATAADIADLGEEQLDRLVRRSGGRLVARFGEDGDQPFMERIHGTRYYG